MKRAEKRDSKAMGAMQGMGGYQQQHGGHPGYGAAAYAQTGISLHESTLMTTPLRLSKCQSLLFTTILQNNLT